MGNVLSLRTLKSYVENPNEIESSECSHKKSHRISYHIKSLCSAPLRKLVAKCVSRRRGGDLLYEKFHKHFANRLHYVYRNKTAERIYIFFFWWLNQRIIGIRKRRRGAGKTPRTILFLRVRAPLGVDHRTGSIIPR